MEEWMWDQVLLTRDANLTVKKATPSGNPTILYQLILPHLVLRGVSCECKRRVDEMLFRYLPAQLHTWKFSPVLFFADEVRSHADLKPPYQIKSRAMDLGACQYWHPAVNDHPACLLGVGEALGWETPWVRYFLVANVDRTGKSTITVYHKKSAAALTKVLRPPSLTLLAVGLLCRLSQMGCAGLNESTMVVLCCSLLTGGCYIMRLYCELDLAHDDPSWLLWRSEHVLGPAVVISTLAPVTCTALSGWITLATLPQSWLTVVIVAGVSVLLLSYSAASVDFDRRFTDSSTVGYAALAAWLFPGLWLSLDLWKSLLQLLSYIALSCVLVLGFYTYHSDLEINPDDDTTLRYMSVYVMSVCLTACAHLVVSTVHTCFIELPYTMHMGSTVMTLLLLTLATIAFGILTTGRQSGRHWDFSLNLDPE